MSMKKMQRRNLTPLPMPKRSVAVQVPLNDGNLPGENKQLVVYIYIYIYIYIY